MSSEEVPWESSPEGSDWLTNELRLSKGGKHWDHDWRREHRGHGRYPENELWDAVEGYLDLLDASQSSDPDA